jgi:hypothetical protein
VSEDWPPRTFTVWLRYFAQQSSDAAGQLIANLQFDLFVYDFRKKRAFVDYVQGSDYALFDTTAANTVWRRFKNWQRK